MCPLTAEWNGKSEGFKLFVLRLLCEKNTRDTFSGPFGGRRKKEELMWTRRKRRVWQVIPGTSIAGGKRLPFSSVLWTVVLTPPRRSLPCRKRQGRAFLSLERASPHRERRPVFLPIRHVLYFGGPLVSVRRQVGDCPWCCLGLGAFSKPPAPDMLCLFRATHIYRLRQLQWQRHPRSLDDLSLGFMYLI